MVDVETDVVLAWIELCYVDSQDNARGRYIHEGRVRRHITGVELDGANDIPLFLIYKTLVPKVLHASTTAVIRLVPRLDARSKGKCVYIL